MVSHSWCCTTTISIWFQDLVISPKWTLYLLEKNSSWHLFKMVRKISFKICSRCQDTITTREKHGVQLQVQEQWGFPVEDQVVGVYGYTVAIDTTPCKNYLFLSDTHKLNVKEKTVTFSRFCNWSGKAKV